MFDLSGARNAGHNFNKCSTLFDGDLLLFAAFCVRPRLYCAMNQWEKETAINAGEVRDAVKRTGLAWTTERQKKQNKQNKRKLKTAL